MRLNSLQRIFSLLLLLTISVSSIGIVLCKNANKKFVEYVIQDYQKPMGVATYTTAGDMPEELPKALPDMEELKRILSFLKKTPDM